MRHPWERLAAGLTVRPKRVLALCAVVTVLLAAGSTRLEFATGQDSYLNADSQVAVDNARYQSLFGGQAMITVFAAERGRDALDLFAPSNRARLESLRTELDRIDGVYATATPLSAMEWNQALVAPAAGSNDPSTSVAGRILLSATARETDPARQQARLADAATTLSRATAAGSPSFDNRKWLEFLLVDNAGNIREAMRPFFPTPPGTSPTFANATRAQMVIRLDGNQTSKEEGRTTEATQRVLNRTTFDGFTTSTTGAPALLKDINDYLMGGMMVLGVVALVVMLAVLFGVFRVRWRLVPLLSMAVGVVWTFGVLGFVGFELSIVTIAGLPILIGLGVEFAIQVQNRVEEETSVAEGRAPVEALERIGPALAVSTVAAVLACLALRASLTPMIRDFGILLAVGVAFVFLAALIVPSAMLAWRGRGRPVPGRRRQRRVEALMTRLAHVPPTIAPALAIVAAGLFAGGLFAERATPIQTDPNRWVDQDSRVIEDIDRMQSQTGASSELGVFLEDRRGVLTDEVGRFATSFALDELGKYPGKLSTVSSLPTTVYYLMTVPGASQLPPTGDNLRAAFEAAPVDLRRSMVADGGSAANIVFQTGPSTLEVRKEVAEDIRANVDPPPGITATPSGLAVIGVALLDNLTANRLMLTYLALGAVTVWLLVRLRSITRAAVVAIPVVFAVGLSAVAVTSSRITVSPLTTVSSPLVIAVCGEFSLLILFRHLEERARGLTADAAIDVAAARTGRAFFASSLTTVGGFAVLLFSPLPLLRDFGAIVAITIAIALLSAMVVMPPVLIWTDRRGLLGNTTATDAGEASADDGGLIDLRDGAPEPSRRHEEVRG